MTGQLEQVLEVRRRQPVLERLGALDARPLGDLDGRLPGEVVVADDDPRGRPGDSVQTIEEELHVEEVSDDIACHNEVKPAGDRELLHVGAHEAQVWMTRAAARHRCA